MSPNHSWHLSLETPAANRFLHVIRLTAAGAAAEAGLTAEEVDDVKIAIDELCSMVIAVSSESDHLRMSFSADDAGLVIEAVGPADGELEIDELAQAILDATVDELQSHVATPGVGFRLTKRRSGG